MYNVHMTSLRFEWEPRKASANLKKHGISFEEAVSMMVSGFCRDVFNQLPMEFAVEAQKLLEISLEGSVG